MKSASYQESHDTRKSPRHSPSGHSIGDFLRWGRKELEVLGAEESRVSTEQLLGGVLGLERYRLYLDFGENVPRNLATEFRRLIALRKRRVPLAYLLGKAYFWKEVLEVGSGCLIPRPETEILVARAIEKCGNFSETNFSFLDLGAGSGAIGIALLREFPHARATFSDISEMALGYAKKNLSRYDLWARAEVVHSDLFQSFRGKTKRKKWDAIFCNPPYLSEADWKEVAPEILCEPREALDGGKDGLVFYRRIIQESEGFLRGGGYLMFELGQKLSGRICQALRKKRFFEDVCVFKDYSGNDRVVTARLSD